MNTDTKEALATQSTLTDEGTGKKISGEFIFLIDNTGVYHYFQDWQSVAEWAQANANEA